MNIDKTIEERIEEIKNVYKKFNKSIYVPTRPSKQQTPSSPFKNFKAENMTKRITFESLPVSSSLPKVGYNTI